MFKIQVIQIVYEIYFFRKLIVITIFHKSILTYDLIKKYRK